MNVESLGILPISQDSPAGEDVRYQSVFEELQAEVDKLSLPSAASGAIDWQKIASLSSSILAETSKDLLVAAYFSVAHIHLQGLAGAVTGVQVFSDVIDNFWETLFPSKKRMRGRVAAIEWWLEKSESALQPLMAGQVDGSLREHLITLVHHLDELLGQQIADGAPAFHSLVRAIEELPVAAAVAPSPQVVAESAPAPSPAAPPAQESAGAMPAGGSQTTAARSPVTAEAQPVASLEGLLQGAQNVAGSIFEQNQTDPMAYRLTRFSLWSAIVALPQANDGRTFLPPPEPQIVEILSGLMRNGQWQQLLVGAEYQLPQYRFWLDLNRFTATALENLGPACQEAVLCVARETAFFLLRFPGLASLHFADGTPFAVSETVDWLQTISLGSAASAMPRFTAGDAGDTAAQQQTAEIMQAAEEKLRTKDLIGAVTLLQEAMHQSPSQKEKMRWRLELCRLLVTSNNASLAVPHFIEILNDIDSYRLDQWDPPFALQALKAIWAGYQKVSERSLREGAGKILHRISRIDPVEAIRIGK